VNSVLSMKLGQRDSEGVNQTAGNSFLILWVMMIVFAILGFTAMTPFYEAQTDIPEILEMSISYSMVLCIFSFAALHQIMMERLLSAIGRADLTMIPMLTGAIVNIILDPIMIFGWLGCPAMGITGAGIATVIGQAAAAIAGLLLNLRFNHEVHISKAALRPSGEIIGAIVKIGVPVALSNCLISVSAFGMNNILLRLSALAPGIYVVYIRLQSFVIMPSGGMSSAGISIIAYNYGAREKRRIMDTLWVSLRVNLIIAVIGMLVFLLFPRQLLMMFNASEAMMEIGIPALRIIAAALVLTTTTQILSGFLQALGQGTASFIIAIGQAVFLLLSAWLLSLTGNVNMVWLSFPIMELLRFVFAVFFVGQTYTSKLAMLQPQAA
ncbi:MAG: MATE family efflux transporter, partial [Oscillospiraceae bacterium]|nr:MATE family efflux transporter [Oscillospiraceae bacterium]